MNKTSIDFFSNGLYDKKARLSVRVIKLQTQNQISPCTDFRKVSLSGSNSIKIQRKAFSNHIEGQDVNKLQNEDIGKLKKLNLSSNCLGDLVIHNHEEKISFSNYTKKNHRKFQNLSLGIMELPRNKEQNETALRQELQESLTRNNDLVLQNNHKETKLFPHNCEKLYRNIYFIRNVSLEVETARNQEKDKIYKYTLKKLNPFHNDRKYSQKWKMKLQNIGKGENESQNSLKAEKISYLSYREKLKQIKNKKKLSPKIKLCKSPKIFQKLNKNSNTVLIEKLNTDQQKTNCRMDESKTLIVAKKKMEHIIGQINRWQIQDNYEQEL